MQTLIPLLLSALAVQAAPPLPYVVVDPGQVECYDTRGNMAPPKPGAAFHGQDAQHQGCGASYALGADGLTVRDLNTGLTWQRSPDTNLDGRVNHDDKLTWAQAQARPAALNAARFGGFDDWRFPGIKELYSLFDGRGTDPSGMPGDDTAGLIPYINTNYFPFAYGEAGRGERVIDSQYTTTTRYTGRSARGFDKVFGVNFADGRIKGYDLEMPGGAEKKFYALCVRGNPDYGRNDFHDNGDGTITDRATGLTWSKADNGKGMNWAQALAWVQAMNARRHLGHDDWRLPDIKELQSLVDYTRGPDTTHSAAIDPLFTCSSITNEGGQPDFPYYWSSTSHVGPRGGAAAMYVAFGRASGWLSMNGPGIPGGGPGGPGPGRPAEANRGGPPPGARPADLRFTDVHGAGAQRSDPKEGDPADFPHGRGPQGDVIRIFNYVRLVRGGPTGVAPASAPAVPVPATPARVAPPAEPPGGPAPARRMAPLFSALDANSDGIIDEAEMAGAAAALKKLDKNGDGRLSPEETRPQGPGGMPPGDGSMRPGRQSDLN